MRAWLVAFALSGCCVDCAGDDVHGRRVKSPDGGTQLIAGPFDWKCAAKIDGAPVTQGAPVAVKPGLHRVECDTEALGVHVPAGMTVTVDYFGP